MMALIEPVVMQLLMNGINRPSTPILPTKTGMALTALSVFLGGTGLVYMMIAFHEIILAEYSPLVAALGTGALALLLAAFSATAACHLDDLRKAKARLMHDNTRNNLLEAIEAATRGLEEPIADHPRASVLLASLAGYMAGNKLH